MTSSERVRARVGALTLIAGAGAVATFFASLPAAERQTLRAAMSDVSRLHLDGMPRRTVTFAGAHPWLVAGDGLYQRVGADLRRVGQVLEVMDVAAGRSALVEFDPAVDAALDTGTRLTAHSSGASLAWTVDTLLPLDVRQRIRQEVDDFTARNRENLETTLEPLVADLLEAVAPLLLAETGAALERHRDEIEALGRRYRSDVLEAKLLPMLREELAPRLAVQGGPPLRAVGRELWDALPLFSLAYQSVKQGIDPRDRRYAEERFAEFVAQEALPILRRHRPALESTLMRILEDAAADERVVATLRDTASTLVGDAELRSLVAVIVSEVARGEPLRAAIEARLAEPDTRDAIESLRGEIDRTFQRIGRRIVFANEETLEVHPEFARFLRTLVLKKDRRFVLLEPGTGEPLPRGAPLAGRVADE
jgi:hypothetical protein